MRTTFVMLIAIALFVIFTSISYAETKVMDQNVRDCESGETISNEVKPGEKIEVRISVLVSEEKEISLFSGLTGAVFYVEENRVGDNTSAQLTLGPGTHTLRVVGSIPMSADEKEIVLLGSDNLGKYVTARISSPYILKDNAIAQTFVSGLTCTIFGGLAVFLATRRRMKQVKAGATKRTAEKGEKAKVLVKNYLEIAAPNLNYEQRKRAKTLMKELEGLLK